ncbi:hypothetical protein [Serinicoccus kebangsaanensis]|uniref:hypothetical protein n=1 Tax=Serinicoccus kebangsaanensis TaxID=2602069 RepID=UPI00124F2984|nr:hypothetical protein [Serinicoccus kebangsaanensis]
MSRTWTWVAVLFAAGVVLSLPQVWLWRPTPDTPLATGVYLASGLTYHLAGMLMGVSAIAAALLVATRTGVLTVRHRPGARLLWWGIALVVLGLLGPLLGQGLVRGEQGGGMVEPAWVLTQVTSWVAILGYGLIAGWLVSRPDPRGGTDDRRSDSVRDPSQMR